MITCGWCHTNYGQWRSNCDNCGGPLPRPAGMDLGPPPPDAPRRLPGSFVFRVKWSRNVSVIIGVVVAAVSALFLWASLKSGGLFAVVPGLFLLGGALLFRHGRGKALGQIRALRHGVAVEGTITELAPDTTQSINGRHPWRLVYHFTADGQVREGIQIAFDGTLGTHHVGQPLWIVYLPAQPEQCAIYPPVA